MAGWGQENKCLHLLIHYPYAQPSITPGLLSDEWWNPVTGGTSAASQAWHCQAAGIRNKSQDWNPRDSSHILTALPNTCPLTAILNRVFFVRLFVLCCVLTPPGCLVKGCGEDHLGLETPVFFQSVPPPPSSHSRG